MLDAKDTTYYNVSGMLIYDPSIAVQRLQTSVTAVPFVNYWGGLFPFNDSFTASINKRHQDCGYADYLNKYLVYPPPGPQPVDLPGQGKDNCDIFDDIYFASLAVNPCWDIYQVSATCPLLYDVLGCRSPSSSSSTHFFDYENPSSLTHLDSPRKHPVPPGRRTGLL